MAPARLALVTVFQFVEGLSDRQAPDAVRGRSDALSLTRLCLPPEDPGFDASVLPEFRSRSIARGAETLLFETLLAVLKEEQLVKPRSRQRTDSPHVLAAIHVLNRLELVGETLRHALNTLATVVPEWLRPWVPSEWFDRYAAALRASARSEEYRLPDGLVARTAMAEQIGADGRRLLTAIFETADLAWLLQVPAGKTLWRVWVQQFYAGDPITWRKADDLPPSAVSSARPTTRKRATARSARRSGPPTRGSVKETVTSLNRQKWPSKTGVGTAPYSGSARHAWRNTDQSVCTSSVPSPEAKSARVKTLRAA